MAPIIVKNNLARIIENNNYFSACVVSINKSPSLRVQSLPTFNFTDILRVSAVKDPTWSIENMNAHCGVSGNLLVALSNYLKATHLVVYPEVSYGSKRNGKWNGLIGSLVNNKSDFTV